jgi:hypothetical protein
MPKRVLEIDRLSLVLRARLVTDAPLAPYVALSYCWGGDQIAKTVKSRVVEYENGIPLDTLPQTIFDALVVTRGIGLQYLWVDAMCIIQDDCDDMAEQIGQMYAVYRSAYVTISAATAATSQEVRTRIFRSGWRLQPHIKHLLTFITGIPPITHQVQGLHVGSSTRRQRLRQRNRRA